MYVSVHIDEDEVLSELPTEALRKELNRRTGTECPEKRECNQTLDDVAFKLRKAGHIALAYRVDEIRHDYFIY